MDNKYDAVLNRLQCWYVPNTAITVTEETIRAFESEIGYELPADYRHFLTKYGFAAGNAYTIHISQDPMLLPETSVGAFYGLGPSPNHTLSWIREMYHGLGIDQRLLPIANSDSGKICLSLCGPDRGRLYLWVRPDMQLGDEDEDVLLLAYDFDSFMNGLQHRDSR